MQQDNNDLRKENDELRNRLAVFEGSHAMIIEKMRAEYETRLRSKEASSKEKENDRVLAGIPVNSLVLFTAPHCNHQLAGNIDELRSRK